eukprot:IDg14665t1
MEIFCSTNQKFAFSFESPFFKASGESKIATVREWFTLSSVIGGSYSWFYELSTWNALMPVDCAL